MNFFRFLDDTVRGSIQFVFGFFYVTAMLIRHPILGPSKIFRAYKSFETERLSSLTYLALAMLLTIALVGQIASGEWGVIPHSMLDAAKQMFGGETGSFVPAVLGALAGTILLASLIRLLAWARGFEGRRRERFISGSEYAFGVATLLTVIIIALYEAVFQLESSGRIGPFASGALVGFVLSPIYMIAGILIVAQFWTGLARDPRALRMARDYHRLHRIRRKQGWRAFWRARKAVDRRFLGFHADEKVAPLSYIGRSLKIGALVGLVMVAPFFVSTGAMLSGSYVAQLASAEEEPVEILTIVCDLASAQPTASAAVWNRSDRPVTGWLGKVHIHVDTYQHDGSGLRTRLGWRAGIPEGRLTDLLGPRQSMEVTGPVEVPADAGPRIRNPAYSSCGGEVRDPYADLLNWIMENSEE